MANAKEDTDPLLKLLPILEPRVVKPVNGFPLTFTTHGDQLKFLEMDSEAAKNKKIWSELPKHYWAVVGKVKPGAQPLAYVAADDLKAEPKEAGSPETEPGRNTGLIVYQNYGFGRVLYVGLDSTWRWRYRTGDTYHHRFWGQVVRWAASDKPLVAGNDHIRFGTHSPIYQQGTEIDLVARLSDAEKPLAPDALAGARIYQLLDNDKEERSASIPLKRKDVQPRMLEGKIPPYLPPGKYAIELNIPEMADKLEAPVGPDGKRGKLRATFSISPTETEESLELATNYPLLEDLAAKSGGKVFTPENAGELVELLTKKTVTRPRDVEHKLWEMWPTLLVFLLLLTVEWVARKLSGLP